MFNPEQLHVIQKNEILRLITQELPEMDISSNPPENIQ